MSHNKEKEEKVHVYPDGRNKLLIKELAELWFKDIEKL